MLKDILFVSEIYKYSSVVDILTGRYVNAYRMNVCVNA